MGVKITQKILILYTCKSIYIFVLNICYESKVLYRKKLIYIFHIHISKNEKKSTEIFKTHIFSHGYHLSRYTRLGIQSK